MGSFWFRWGPLGSQEGDPPPEVKDGVGSCRKIGLSADLEDVQLDLNDLKMGSENMLFFESFGWFLGSGGVP